MKTRILTLHFALFFKDMVDRPDIEFSDLNSKMLNLFDAIPRILPIPRELPVDVPIVVLASENNAFTCNISRSRIDFILTRISDEKSNTDMLKDFNAKVSGFVKVCTEKLEISRFGMVAKYFIQNTNPAITLKKKYFTNALDGAAEITLRYVKKSDYYGFIINDILEISAAEAVTNGKVEKGIYIQRDINNNQVIGKQLSIDVLEKLSQKYAALIGESDILGLLK